MALNFSCPGDVACAGVIRNLPPGAVSALHEFGPEAESAGSPPTCPVGARVFPDEMISFR